MLFIHLEELQPELFSVTISIDDPISVLLVVRKEKKKAALKTAEEKSKEETARF